MLNSSPKAIKGRNMSFSLTKGPRGIDGKGNNMPNLPDDIIKLIIEIHVQEFWSFMPINGESRKETMERRKTSLAILPLLLTSRAISELTIPLLYAHIYFVSPSSYTSFLLNSNPACYKHIQSITVRTHLGAPPHEIIYKPDPVLEKRNQAGYYPIADQERKWRIRVEGYARDQKRAEGGQAGDGGGDKDGTESGDGGDNSSEREIKKGIAGIMQKWKRRWFDKREPKETKPKWQPFSIDLGGVVPDRVEMIGAWQTDRIAWGAGPISVPTFDYIFRPSQISLQNRATLAICQESRSNIPGDYTIPILKISSRDLYIVRTLLDQAIDSSGSPSTSAPNHNPKPNSNSNSNNPLPGPSLTKPLIGLVDITLTPVIIDWAPPDPKERFVENDGLSIQSLAYQARMISEVLEKNDFARVKLTLQWFPHCFCTGGESAKVGGGQADGVEVETKMTTFHSRVELACCEGYCGHVKRDLETRINEVLRNDEGTPVQTFDRQQLARGIVQSVYD